jgi:hypothetical protein
MCYLNGSYYTYLDINQTFELVRMLHIKLLPWLQMVEWKLTAIFLARKQIAATACHLCLREQLKLTASIHVKHYIICL